MFCLTLEILRAQATLGKINVGDKAVILNETMVDALHSIREIESSRTGKQLNVPANELGNRLIVLYYKTRRLATRELITLFMTQAGVVWLRKLLTRDISPIASSPARFACLNDYLGLLAANDDAPDACFANA